MASNLQVRMKIRYTIEKKILKAMKVNIHLSLCPGNMYELNQGWWCTIVIPAIGRWKQEEEECRAVLSHVGKSAWPT